ncbi:MAG TPA: hypothetical protein VHU79_07605 [Sphingomicrobium sp.]|nr:hypothetical protein [Sphingomicrobium sp.]
MPYRHAYWYLLALFPLVGLAFWPNYFAIFSTASVPLHAHAAAGTLWIGILAAQSWLIHQDRRDIHRQMGIASLGVFPFFVAASAAVSVLMAQQFVSRLSPFGVAYAPRLGLGSIVLVTGFAYCYWQGLRWRRKVHPHSRYMLSTVVFLLPPIFERLYRFVPFLQVRGPQDFWKFSLDILLANAVTAAIVFYLAWRAGKHGRPFVEAGALIVMNEVLIQGVGVTTAWRQLYAHLASVPLPAFTLAAGLAGIIIAYSGWLAGKRTTPSVGLIPA